LGLFILSNPNSSQNFGSPSFTLGALPATEVVT
jgi:hypothetical protein